MMQIPFNRAFIAGTEKEYIDAAINFNSLSGNGIFTAKCHRWLEVSFFAEKALLTHSCTAALEMSAILAEIEPGDEVIMPSYTFVSTANAFLLRGGVPVFVDIKPETMNIDESLIEKAITEKTKVIVPVHYAGVACAMDEILSLAEKYNLLVIEDAAQAMQCTYKGRSLGSMGQLATLSFHETKNINCGEGGALLINDAHFTKRAEIIWQKGTNRNQFFRGEVDKYSWVDIGSSFLPSELNAAFLFAQMEMAEAVTAKRLDLWKKYHAELMPLSDSGKLEIPVIAENCRHNAHMFYIKTKDLQERTALIQHLKAQGITSVFHYVPLHTSAAGAKYSRFSGEDKYTTRESERLLRLPLYYELSKKEVAFIVQSIKDFYYPD
jgi:dTDP-4-amino-4,6-dideoxygalactose transaminase